jgi:hypothetical protein
VIAYLERVRPPGRAGIAQSLEVRAVVVARFRGDGRVAKLRVDGAWFGQGGMTKAETDARWLTGRTRAANPGGRRTCSRMRASSLDDKMTGPMAADAASRRGRGRECALLFGSRSL